MPASIRDVAELAGVSVGTVSNYFNRPQIVSADAVTRVRDAVERLEYVRNAAARTLRAGVGISVGFVVLNGQNPFFADVVRGAEDEASKHGIAIIHGNTDEDSRRESRYLDLFEEQQVRGVLIAPYGEVTSRLERLRARGIPSVLIDRFSGDRRFSSVSVDSVLGGRMAVEHLIERGSRRIAFVGGPFDLHQVNDRLAGARIAADNAMPAVGLEIVPTAALTLSEGIAAGTRIASRPQAEWPDAIFASNDLLALGLLQTLVHRGRRLVPDEIALIGFDDISFASAAAVPLSSIRQPGRMIGRTALRVLLEESSDREALPRQTVFPAELVVRASTGR